MDKNNNLLNLNELPLRLLDPVGRFIAFVPW